MQLIFHIGAGKTGTSSIQLTLKSAQEQLRARGFMYLGLVLEHAPIKRYEWQEFGATAKLHQLHDDVGGEEVFTVLTGTVEIARSQAIHTLIWSSESFFDRPQKALWALRRLLAQGVSVRIMAYVRRHDQWARSAYVQWAIKHKTMRGKIPDFKSWVERRPPVFQAKILPYLKLEGSQFSLRNLDQAKDAVTDFLDQLDLGNSGIPHLRENTTSGDEEIFARAVFNNANADTALPSAYNRAVGRFTSFNDSYRDFLSRYLPTNDQLASICREAAGDIEYVNQLLADSNQPRLCFDSAPINQSTTSDALTDELLLTVCRLLMHQSQRLDAMDEEIS